MAESEFSWLKIASFVGACLLVVVAFVAISSGIEMLTSGNGIYGVFAVLGGSISIALAAAVYKNYQNKRR